MVNNTNINKYLYKFDILITLNFFLQFPHKTLNKAGLLKRILGKFYCN